MNSLNGRVFGKTILVTGGSAGLGAAFVRRLTEEGAKVFIADINDEAGEALASETKQQYVHLDVRNENQWCQVLNLIDKSGGLDGLVNNAGIASSKGDEDIEGFEVEDLHHIFSVNVDGTLLGCKHAIPVMAKSGGGSIVNLSSIAGLIPSDFVISYGASKATVAHSTRSVAMHCAKKGYSIRCNSVHPGQIKTTMMDSIFDSVAYQANVTKERTEDLFLTQIPLGKFQEAEDIAHAVLFLLSEEARYITGTQLIVDGGMTLSN